MIKPLIRKLHKMFDIQKGLENLRKHIEIAPSSAGVYRMISFDDEVLYVGKAKNIKKRIVAYSHFDKLPKRLQQMVAQIYKMEFIVVDTEARALLVENELIKRYKPKYNILLKDDKTFPYLMIDKDSDFPKLVKYRGARKGKNKYFGPFASVLAVNEVLGFLQKVFLLRSCRDSVFNNRSRPCLMYQIKKCSAPCVGMISKEEYKKAVDKAIDFLEGENCNLQQVLSQEMEQASKELNFEKALILRDRIRALSNIQSKQNVEYSAIKSADVIAVAIENNLPSVEIFFIRSGQNCGNAVYFPMQAKDVNRKEVLEAFLGEFYTSHPVPKEIIVSEEVDVEWWQNALSAKIIFPKLGNKKKMLDFVYNNAVDAIRRKIAQEASVQTNLKELQQRFGLKRIPERIEVYDNSHNQGSFAIGAMIVATPKGFDKQNYRIFDIKQTLETRDDFAMMQEVLRRRFDKMTAENKPDLILIDGGRGQLNSVYKILEGYDLSDIVIVAISKGEDRNAGREFYHMKDRDSFDLEYRSPLAFYLQNLRDEAHRFAIGTHRKKRSKSIAKSGLDEIDGIGKARKRELLRYFGSLNDVAQATIQDLQKIEGISKKTAEKIYNYFHN